MTPSPYQQSIYDAGTSSNDSLIIEAVAGSGKTTTIEELAKLLPKQQSILFLAFNKNIVNELERRLPIHIQKKTFHSHCNGALVRALPHRPRIDGDKVKWILKDSLTDKDFFRYSSFVMRLVSYAKNAGVGIDGFDAPSMWNLIEHHNLFLDSDGDEETAVGIAETTLEQSNKELHRIDFDDMLYLALKLHVRFDKFNVVFVDEAQDTNTVQRELLRSFIATPPNGRLIAVGDPHQAIYGFRGADVDALQQLGDAFGCKRMPLSVSYRCSKAVVDEAQTYVEHILPHNNATDGQVHTLGSYTPEIFNPEDAIICRNVAPLVSMAFGLIRRGKGVRILGRDIGAGLITLVKKMNATSVEQLGDKLEAFRQREEAKAYRRDNPAAADAVNEKVGCLNIFIDQLDESNRTITALCTKITELFTDNNVGLLTLCTIHKAKGLEWNRVFILDRWRMPSKYATQEWQLRQETNLIYVAITRAKEELVYILSENWEKPKVELSKMVQDEIKRKELLASL